MTTTPTLDVEATVNQAIRLAEAGCEVVRVTAQNVKAAEALADIRKKFSAAGFGKIPLVADIHFLPKAAMEAAKHVEKVRINPGNYADQKKFKVREYSDIEYEEELERLHEAFSPIVLRCRELGRAMRIGTNHGSLSDRILNRYGDTPMGMCESALEFIRIAESNGFHDIILSMKASNPKVMIQAYRLMVARMAEEKMAYPLHLGVTEAGDGDDARIKSAIGIGSLLYDGLGDTIRVSLTEDPVAELPVAKALADKAMSLWSEGHAGLTDEPIDLDPFSYNRREVASITMGGSFKLGPMELPRVIQPASTDLLQTTAVEWADHLDQLQRALKEARIEGLLLPYPPPNDQSPADVRLAIGNRVDAVIWEPATAGALPEWSQLVDCTLPGDAWCVTPRSAAEVVDWQTTFHRHGFRLVLSLTPDRLRAIGPDLPEGLLGQCILTLASDNPRSPESHPLGTWRQLSAVLGELRAPSPLWIRNRLQDRISPDAKGFGDALLEASMLSGALLCDGIGDMISIETVPSPRQATTLAYNILQGARCRTSKTEYVACPSCGRTLFDLQSTTRQIREATGHLKGVTIAVMGCIVNGPGEMADADFGYVGGAPGKINLYVGKDCVQYHIPSEEAVQALIALIRQHGKWTDPPSDA
jgi:(E)-4-hydroxy-3-methylbut-2-enyl-diphosphate synthase